MQDETQHAARPPRPPRHWLGWALVGVAGVVVIGSFALSLDDDAAAKSQRDTRPSVVAAVTASRGKMTEQSRYAGELDADAADISSFYAGRVLSLRVRVGDSIEQGDIVAELDPVDAQEQLARARAQAEAARAEQERASIDADAAAAELARLEPGQGEVISTSELEAQRARAAALRSAVTTAAARRAEALAGIRLLERRLIESKVRAPFSGRIGERYVDPGAIVPAGAALVRLVAVSPLRVRFRVPERELAGLRVGTSLRVVTSVADSGEVVARVTGIPSEVSRDERLAALEAVVDSPPPGWLPGMFADVIVDRRTIDDATLVPLPAILSRMQPDGALVTGVFVAEGGIARWVPVTIVARDVAQAAVEGPGLSGGVAVLVAGHLDLTDGSKVTIADDRATAEDSR